MGRQYLQREGNQEDSTVGTRQAAGMRICDTCYVFRKPYFSVLSHSAVFTKDGIFQLGFHGRAGKPDDTCYAFWIGATLEVSAYRCLLLVESGFYYEEVLFTGSQCSRQ